MLLTREVMKHLKQIDDNTFEANVNDMDSSKKEKLKNLDELWYLSKGYHLVKNYKNL